VSPIEFYNGIEALGIKITFEDINKIFPSLDKDGDGQINYNEFCNLCEERRRNIDPFIQTDDHSKTLKDASLSLSTKSGSTNH
jgi:hypothetical protein